MKQARLIKEVVMSDGSDSDLTVGKVYQVYTSNYPRYGCWYVLDNKGEQHHFHDDDTDFKTADYWQEV